PDWARASRPLAVVFIAIALLVTYRFDADVDAQGGAYATGVLFLMTSASVAVTIAEWERTKRYLPMTLIFVYTTAMNIHERPEGLKIASLFILGIVCSSILSRVIRSTELRIGRVKLNNKAQGFVDEVCRFGIRIVAHRPDKRTAEEYARKEYQAREDHSLEDEEPLLFLEV